MAIYEFNREWSGLWVGIGKADSCYICSEEFPFVIPASSKRIWIEVSRKYKPGYLKITPVKDGVFLDAKIGSERVVMGLTIGASAAIEREKLHKKPFWICCWY